MNGAMVKQQDQPHKFCLLRDCRGPALKDECLCALHYYQLPRATRQALAIQDEQTRYRNLRLVRFVLGGQPLERILFT